MNQYGRTHRIRGKNHISIQKIKQSLRVMGLEQIPKEAELASATLERRAGDYFLHVTTFQPKVERKLPQKVLGVDFGIHKQLTLSNGMDIREGVMPTNRLKRIHRELSRRKLHGKNYQKTQLKLEREYRWLANRRKDIKNKIVSRLVSNYETVCVQDDSIKEWEMMWGRRVQASAIGGIMSAIKQRAHTLVAVPRFMPTTKTCSGCRAVQDIGLGESIYQCRNCGLRIDRNLNSAINIQNEGEGVPTGHREFTPADTKAAIEMMGYFNSIPNVSASLVVEAGSHVRTSRWW